MKTKNILLLGAAVLAMGMVACGDDGEGTGGSPGTGGATATGSTGTPSSSSTGTPTSSSSGDTSSTGEGAGGEGGGGEGGAGGEGGSGPPAAPELGPQVERMGRPAINTALNDTFIVLTNGGQIAPSDNITRAESEDNYNEAVNGSDEAQAFITTHALQLTVLDSLDGECGNQPLWGLLAEDGDCDDSVTGQPVVCYGALATVLNNDALWVKTDYESCGVYLGVEADTAAVFPGQVLPANEDCGGRRPIDDVIRTTYSVVAGSAVIDPDGTTPQSIFLFDDGINPPADLHPEDFPYLAAPH